MRVGWAGGIIVALSALAMATAAYARENKLIVQKISPPPGELVAPPNGYILRQPVTGLRAARLEEDGPLPDSLARIDAPAVPAGTITFGATVDDAILYCAVVKYSLYFSAPPALVCYQDKDQDGRFDQVRTAGSVNGVLLLITGFSPAEPLATPVRYTAAPYSQGPSMELGLRWRRPPSEKGRAATTDPQGQEDIVLETDLLYLNKSIRAGRPVVATNNGFHDLRVNASKPTTVELTASGGRITVLGFTASGDLRYRIDEPYPTRLETMNVATPN